MTAPDDSQRSEPRTATHVADSEAASSFRSRIEVTTPYLPSAEQSRSRSLPQEFGNYVLLEELGTGGMGVVYKARQKSPDRLVALKMIRAGQLANQEEVRRFRQEADQEAALDHPNIVPVFEFGDIGGQHYFSMKLVEGGPLSGQLGRYRDDPRAAARMAANIARAVHHAHQRQLLHRDLKPQNVLIDATGQPHVADFGLARRLDTEGATLSGAIVGTPEYMPPEQATGQKHLTTAADVYGLGAILYALLTGKPPFKGGNMMETLQQVSSREPPPPRSLNPRVPRDLETICLKSLAKDPSRRYGSAEALAEDLDCFLRNEPISARPAGRMERVWRWCRRNPRAAVLTGSVAILVVLLTVGSLIAAVWLKSERDNARTAEERAVGLNKDRLQELYRAYVNESRASRRTGQPGQRENGLAAIRRILTAFPRDQLNDEQAAELRDEALACLSLGDVSQLGQRNLPAHLFFEADIDPELDLLAWREDDGRTSIEPFRDNPSMPRRHLPPPPSSVFRTTRTFSSNGPWLVELHHSREQALGPHRLRIWDCKKGDIVADRPIPLPADQPVFHPKEPWMLLPSLDGLAVVELPSGRELRNLPARFGRCMAFSPDGSRLALGRQNLPSEIIDTTTGLTVATIPEVRNSSAVAWSPTGRHVVFAGPNGDLYIWFVDLHLGHPLSSTHRARVEMLAFSFDGEYLAASAVDNTCSVRRTTGDRVLFTLPGRIMRFSRNSYKFALFENNRLTLYHPTGDQEYHVVHEPADGVEFSPDGDWLALAGWEGLTLFRSHDLSHAGHVPLDWCGPVSFRPDGRELVTFGLFNHAWRWPITPPAPGKLEWQFGPPRRTMPRTSVFLEPQHFGRHAVWTRDGKTLVLADFRDQRVFMIDTEANKPARVLATLRHVTRVAVSPDNAWVAGGASIIVRAQVWDAATGRTVLDLPDHGTVAFSPDGQWFASASRQKVHLYRVGTWVLERVFERNEVDDVASAAMAFQPNGKLIAYAVSRTQVRLCDRESGRIVANLTYPEPVNTTWLTFSPDGTRLAYVRLGRGAGMWDLDAFRRGLADLGLDNGDMPSRATARPWHGMYVTFDRGKELPPPQLSSTNWLTMAEYEAIRGKMQDAIDAVTEALHKLRFGAPSSERAELLARRGDYLFRGGSLHSARDDWQQALALDRTRPNAARGLGRLALLGPAEFRAPDQAYGYIAPLANQDEPEIEDLVLQALAHVRLNQPMKALAILQKLPKDAPQPLVGYITALAYQQLGRMSDASTTLTEAKAVHDRRQRSLSASERDELDRLRVEVEKAVDKQ